MWWDGVDRAWAGSLLSDLFLQPLFTWRSAVASEFGPAIGTTRHVLLTLGLHMNEKGESCFPSIDLLTTETNISRRAVLEHLKIAKETGWIGKRALRKPNGQGWRRVEYFALIPHGVEAAFHAKQRSALGALALGGEPDAPRQGGARSAKGGAPDDIKVVHQLHPSTSVSTSITPKSPAARRTSLPADFSISNRVRVWASEKGFEEFLPGHLEKFLSAVKASGRRYADWDEAFINCIRDDWGDVRRKALRETGAGAPLAPRKKETCAYCPKPWMSKPNGIPACDGHTTDAMDQKPREKVAA